MTLSGFLLNRKYTCESVFDVELSKRQTKYKLKLMCMKYNYESCIVELRAVCTSTAECRNLVSYHLIAFFTAAFFEACVLKNVLS